MIDKAARVCIGLHLSDVATVLVPSGSDDAWTGKNNEFRIELLITRILIEPVKKCSQGLYTTFSAMISEEKV